MSKKLIKLGSLLISAALIFSVITGCGTNSGNTSTQSSSEQSTVSAPTASGTTAAETESAYPINTDVKLTYWTFANANVTANYENLGDTPFAKELEKKTGVKVEYQHPPIGQEKDSFSIMSASGDLPDIVEGPVGKSSLFIAGPEAAIQSNVILKLNDYMGEYAPNLSKYLQEHSDIDKMVKTDSGTYYCFPFIRGDEKLLTYMGIIIRNDWLKELGLQSPTTIDEWYTVLKAFKEKKNVESPLSWAGKVSIFDGAAFIGAFGMDMTFYQEDGKVKYGPYEAAYKDFLSTMAKWYKEGLIDKNFATADNKTLNENLLSGKTGATRATAGGGLGLYIPAIKQKDPNADLQPAAYPTLKKGDTPKFGQRELPFARMTCITTACKNVDVAVKWLDYGYSEEGIKLNNFGIEGVSYNMVNGYPTMTDEVLKNPKGYSVGQAWAQYARAVYSGPFIQRKEYIEQYNALPAQQDAVKIWSETDEGKYILPAVTLNADESTEYSKIFNDVDTYMQEYTMKVIVGAESVDSFDNYISQLKNMGIERAIAIQQAALDRYNKR